MPSVLMDERTRLLIATENMVSRARMPDPMRDVVLRYLDSLESYAEVAPYLPPVDFPVMIATLAGTSLPSGAGVALLCHYLGLHMLDDVHDRELPDGLDENEASTVALTCVATLPSLAVLDDENLSPTLSQRVVCELHYHSHPTMTGQFLDISASTDVDVDAACRVLEERNGAIGRVFGRIPAAAVGLPDDEIDLLGEAVASMSMASQILDDIENLWNRPVSSDAANLSKTLPLCYMLEQQGHRRAEILALCERADAQSHGQLRRLIEEQGGLHLCVTGLSILRARALDHLLRFRDRKSPSPVEEYLLDCVAPSIEVDELLADRSRHEVSRAEVHSLLTSDYAS